MAEVALLLSSGQAAALECAAQQQGRTVAQLLRRLIRDHLASEDLLPPAVVIDRQHDDSLAGRRT
jgi:hypothetical protein